jgi:hypothetical protein
MSNLGKITKDYNLQNAEVIETAVIKKEYAVEDLTSITAFDRNINPAFMTSIDTAISHALSFPLDDAVIDQQAAKGIVVSEKMKLGEQHFQDIKYFADKAFPTNTAIKKEFGYNDYSKAKKKPATFVAFLRQLSTTVNLYGTPLKTAGMDEAMLEISAKCADELENASKEHEMAKKLRLLTTQDRTIAYNEVYAKIKLLCSAGKRVFKTNYARYRRYILYENHQTLPPVSEDYISLPAGQTATADIEYNMNAVYLFKNAGVTEIRCYRHDTEDTPNAGEGFILTAGAEVVKEAAEIPGVGSFINVTNLSGTDSGLFLVQYAE